MNQKEILAKTASFVKQKLEGEGTGHDWWHIVRVRNNAIKIAREEDADLFIVELAALLHDIADWKFHGGDEEVGPKAAREWLTQLDVDEPIIAHVCDIIKHISFKGAGVATNMKTKEGMIVQDADRLDAMGAIGIARAFAYGGHKGRELHNPDIPPERHESFEQYKKSTGPTLNHFYEKLFLLKELMNTPTGKKMAEEHHAFMEEYVARFLDEWQGNK
ncbi:MAG: HD domain-containing protein [Candidatus Woesearchaeota archaeon]|nr:HD domain-containing protein [Candidatus Woesearchaeota archaeon]